MRTDKERFAEWRQLLRDISQITQPKVYSCECCIHTIKNPVAEEARVVFSRLIGEQLRIVLGYQSLIHNTQEKAP